MIIPESGSERVMEILHDGHPGVSRMKRIARTVVWWPGLDADIEDKVRSCVQCQVNQKSPAPTCTCTTTSMGMARSSMVSTTH